MTRLDFISMILPDVDVFGWVLQVFPVNVVVRLFIGVSVVLQGVREGSV